MVNDILPHRETLGDLYNFTYLRSSPREEETELQGRMICEIARNYQQAIADLSVRSTVLVMSGSVRKMLMC